MIAHTQTAERHSTATGVPYPRNLRGHGGKQRMKRGREEKKLKIVIQVLENRGMENYRKKETCVSLFLSGASTQGTTQTEKGEIENE